MHRTAARKALFLRRGWPAPQFLHRATPYHCPYFSTSEADGQSAGSYTNLDLPPARPETPYYVDSTATHPPRPSSSAAGSEEGRSQERKRVVLGYQEEQARVLSASLPHVKTLGWSEAAMIAGAKEVGLSPAIVGSFPRKGATLVEYFMDKCLQRLIDSGEDFNGLIPSDRVSKLVRLRLEMQAPYISKWAEALAIQAQPLNVPTSFKQRAMLIDEIWHAAGDESSDVDWYVKRTVLGGIYSTTEVYMLTDSSPGFRDTWVFLNNRVKDAFDLKKTFQEVVIPRYLLYLSLEFAITLKTKSTSLASYLVEAVAAGVGSSLQGFAKKVMRG